MDRSLRQLVRSCTSPCSSLDSVGGTHYKASNTSKSTIKTQEYVTFNNQMMMDKNIKNSDVFKTQVFYKTRVFFQTRLFFKTLVIVSNSAHVTYLLTTITGSNKMNKMALITKMVLSVYCFILCLSREKDTFFKRVM